MYTHLTEQLASQRQAELQTQSAQSTHAGRARRTHETWSYGRTATARHQHRHPIRRRAGYALVSLGLRMAYVAGEN